MKSALLILYAMACTCFSAPTQTEELHKQSLKAYTKTGDTLLRLGEDTYQNFVVMQPKKYHLFVVYTANAQMCRICQPFVEGLEHVALSYMKSGKNDLNTDSLPVFFALVDISVNQEIAQMHDMRTLPHIVHFMGSSLDLRSTNSYISALPDREFPITKLDVSSKEVLDWVNRETKMSDVVLYYTLSERLSRIGLILSVIIGLSILLVKLVIACRKNTTLIAIIGLFIHYIATSGLFYNVLQGMQFVGYEADGVTVQWILNSARGQYLGEGLMMSGLICMSGLSLFAASRIPYTEFGRKASSDIIMYMMLMLLIVSILAVHAVIQVYTAKVGWYSDTSFYPPEWYRRGPLRHDQGNSF